MSSSNRDRNIELRIEVKTETLVYIFCFQVYANFFCKRITNKSIATKLLQKLLLIKTSQFIDFHWAKPSVGKICAHQKGTGTNPKRFQNYSDSFTHRLSPPHTPRLSTDYLPRTLLASPLPPPSPYGASRGAVR